MMAETIQAKDNVIMALSSQVDNMQGEATSPTVRNDLIDFSEPFHDSLKVSCELVVASHAWHNVIGYRYLTIDGY